MTHIGRQHTTLRKLRMSLLIFPCSENSQRVFDRLGSRPILPPGNAKLTASLFMPAEKYSNLRQTRTPFNAGDYICQYLENETQIDTIYND